MVGGASMVVPSIQELAKEKRAQVPERYVRTDLEEPPFVTSGGDSYPQLPFIDMKRLTSTDFMDSEPEKLHQVCKEWGFFQLINHGVDTSLVEKIKKEFKNFFDFPPGEKNKYQQLPGEHEGMGQLFIMSDEQKLDWADMLVLITHPIHLRKPHLFPKFPIPFRDALDAYSFELQKLALKLLDYMAKALKIDPNYIKSLFEDGRQDMRMSYYPPCPQPDKVIGLSANSDATGITILLEANDTQGLQIRKDGKWVPIKPLEKAFIVNIGDILEIITNGAYPSIEHRVVANSEKEWLSIAAFHTAKPEGKVGPAPSIITPQTPALFKIVTVTDYYKSYFSRELDGKSFLDHMRI
ncbi:hypothetical protein Nepgr_021275 [Nepenthes gracilis]|uniref:Fe2OG dioxygenase domain-containing protein n=1 Tax=Nepenthes gracilis TaxID=150966 RepID=A0AAD3SYE0_NEPGR|nr:hypothetical protein Nepgr_021275 [Nepenthes gracilis]